MTQVRIAVLEGFTELVQKLNHDPQAILEKAGLSSTFFSDHVGDDMLSFEQVELLLQTAADTTHCPYFSVLLGSKQNLRLFGLIGYIMQQSRDVRSALNELIEHFPLHLREAATVDLEIIDGFASLNFNVSSHLIKSSQQTTELAMIEGLVILRAVCGDGFKPTLINFRHKAPENITPYKKLFNAPIYFNQDKTQMLFPKTNLDKPINKADPELKAILQSHIELLEKNSANTICDQVTELINRNLPKGKCSIDNIADLLSVHRRTLHRMLKEQGTSFTELLEGVRKDIAIERLNNSDLTIIQLADYLGYADNSAFTRAFKRWYGTTPQKWKKANT